MRLEQTLRMPEPAMLQILSTRLAPLSVIGALVLLTAMRSVEHQSATVPRFEPGYCPFSDALNTKPIEVTIPRPGGPLSVVFDGSRFVRALKQRFTELVREVPLLVNELVSSDIPTLILTAEFDHLNTTEFGHRIASRLKHAYKFEVPGRTHRDIRAKCPMDIAARFVADPMRTPDSSCLATMPRLTFELPRKTPQ